MQKITALYKTLFHFVSLSIVFGSIFATRPVSAQDILPNPAAEQYLINELRATGVADLQTNFSEDERRISGSALLAALKDPEVQSKPLIYVSNVVVIDDLWARDLIIPANLVFSEVEFAGLVNFSGTQLQSFEAYDSAFLNDIYLNDSSVSRQVYLMGNSIAVTVRIETAEVNGYVNISSNTIKGSLSFLRSDMNGDVDLRDNTISEGLNMYGSYVEGELLLDETKILGTQAMSGTSFPVEIWNATVDGVVSLAYTEINGYAYIYGSRFERLETYGAVFKDGVSFSETVVEQTATFDATHFSGDADFLNFHAESDANFRDAVFANTVTFENAFIGRDANFQGTQFKGTASFPYLTVERFADFSGAVFSEEFLFYYTLAGYPYFEGTVFNGHVTFEGMEVTQDFEFIDVSYTYADEPFTVAIVNVDGAASFTNIVAPAGFDFSNSHFGSLSIETDESSSFHFINISGSEIDGDFVIENANLQDLLADGLSVGGSTTLYQVAISNQLDLRNAEIGFLKVDEKFTPPTEPTAFNLRGMTYTDIDLGDQGLTDRTWRGLLMFINDSAYSPQSYQALAQFLIDKGHPDWAAEVELAQKRRERNEVLRPFSGAWLWSWFLDIFSGYGQRPALAFIWSGLVVAMGAFVYRNKENMLPVEQDDVQVEYHPVWYSFALFLPYIDLGIAAKWEPNPERKWARYYKYIHMMLGWILAPIALLTFGGIIG
jgi:uncharacterized protein YjbI with pentapeptide repeats